MMKLSVCVLVVVLVLSVSAGRRKKQGRRGCRGEPEAETQRVEDGEGERYKWTLSGTVEGEMQTSVVHSAFAPSESQLLFVYNHGRRHRSLGIVPSKIMYDFTDDENPVVVIRQGRRGRGSCIVLEADRNDADIIFDDIIDLLEDRNMTDVETETVVESQVIGVQRENDDTQFPQAVRDLCSKDVCGRQLPNPVYYVEADGDVLVEARDEDPSFLLLESRVSIAGLPTASELRQQRRQHRRQNRRQNRRGQGETGGEEVGAEAGGRRRGGGRNGDRQNRRQQRQQRRQQRMNRRGQGMGPGL